MAAITDTIKPIHDNVLVTDMEFGERVTDAGIVIISDDGKTEGVKPRWGRVWAIGPDQHDVKVGDWVLVEHGRWTRGVKVISNNEEIIIRRVEPKAMMAICDYCPNDIYMGQSNPSTTPNFDSIKPL